MVFFKSNKGVLFKSIVAFCSFLLVLFVYIGSTTKLSLSYFNLNPLTTTTKSLILTEQNATRLLQNLNASLNNTTPKLKYLVYECKKTRPCGGWADRLKGNWLFNKRKTPQK